MRPPMVSCPDTPRHLIDFQGFLVVSSTMQPGVAHSSIHTARAIHSTQSVNSTERVNGSSRCWCVACTWTEIRSDAISWR